VALAAQKKPEAARAQPRSDGGSLGLAAEGLTVPIDRTKYKTVVQLNDLEALIARAGERQHIAIDTETTSLDAMRAELVGISIALGPNEAYYIPVGHRRGAGLDLDGSGAIDQLPLGPVIEAAKPLLANPGVLKTGQNLKYDALVLARYGVVITPIDDTMLMSYVLNVGLHGHGLDELASRYLGHQNLTYDEMTGTGKSRISFAEVPLDKATQYAAEDADVTFRLAGILKPRLVAEHLMSVYETLERPLIPVLMEMERAGILVDRTILARLSGDFSQRMAALEEDAHKEAGERFNLGSPKQLGDILFNKMSLTPPRKTKTGAHSTDSDVLETLAAEGHELPRIVLDWRQLQKLKGTYTDALPTYINPETGRVHTSYALASTSTGRLSSSEPNLQNIPIRTSEGRAIRTAFVAAKGCVLMSADYSQIELRVLAHIAHVPALAKAFEDGLDIHAMTASEMFGVPVKGMDPAVRRRAKAINFGIIYGISAFGLANQLGIPRGDAQVYIDTYFQRFPGIRDYMNETKARCRADGFVKTLFGRRINLPHIASKNPAERAFVERAAINAPIQGTAADIIRRAMIRIPPALAKAKLSARMLLQVHDELVFELPPEEAPETMALVRRVMEKAGEPAIVFKVPIVVDAKTGANWDEAH
jgi:DNA polymerase I